MKFRPLLLLVITGLILASTLSSAYFGIMGVRELLRSMLEKKVATTLDAVSLLVNHHFAPAGRLLGTLDEAIASGRVEVAQPLSFARHLAGLLRFEEGIAWVGFGYADGRFVGANVRDGRYFINLSSPGDTVRSQWEILADGKLEVWKHPLLESGYDARERIWFRMAVERDGCVWTPPYDFASGGRGITAAQAVRDQYGALLGVLMVDFLLEDIADYLDRLSHDLRGEPIVFSVNGAILAMPRARHIEPVIEAFRSTVPEAAAQSPEDALGARTRTIEVESGGEKYFVGVRMAHVQDGLDCLNAIVFRRSEVFSAVDRTVYVSLIAAAVALLLSLAAGVLISARMATPLHRLEEEVSRVGRFEWEPSRMRSSGIREIESLRTAVELMKSGLRSFARYVPSEIVRDLVRRGGVATLGGERRSVAIMFCDLAGFTSYAEQTHPEQAVETLSAYFEVFGEAVEAEGGVIDKFLGDGIMALFNAPADLDQPEARAARAACCATSAWLARDPDAALRLDVRVGLHCGVALVGNVGTPERFSYTAIGDAVNTASRLEGLNKTYGTRIIASADFRARCGEGEFLWRTLDRVALAGRRADLEICELVGLHKGCDTGRA